MAPFQGTGAERGGRTASGKERAGINEADAGIRRPVARYPLAPAAAERRRRRPGRGATERVHRGGGGGKGSRIGAVGAGRAGAIGGGLADAVGGGRAGAIEGAAAREGRRDRAFAVP